MSCTARPFERMLSPSTRAFSQTQRTPLVSGSARSAAVDAAVAGDSAADLRQSRKPLPDEGRRITHGGRIGRADRDGTRRRRTDHAERSAGWRDDGLLHGHRLSGSAGHDGSADAHWHVAHPHSDSADRYAGSTDRARRDRLDTRAHETGGRGAADRRPGDHDPTTYHPLRGDAAREHADRHRAAGDGSPRDRAADQRPPVSALPVPLPPVSARLRRFPGETAIEFDP